jgi:WD40 repeat protein
MPAHDANAARQHLLVIACGDYPPESGLDSLDIADEIAFLDGWLANPRLGRRAFTVLAPDLRRNPTKRQIDDAFDAFLADRAVRPYDRMFVYVTGHGETKNGVHHLVLTEYVAQGNQRLYRTSDIVTSIQDLGVQEAVIMIDTCDAADVERSLFTLDHDLPPGYLVVAAAEESAYVRGLTRALTAFIDGGAQDTLSPYLDSLDLWRACGDHLAEQRVHLYPNIAREASVRRSPCLPNPHFDEATSLAGSHQVEASFLVPGKAFIGRQRLMADLVGVVRGPQKTTIVTGGAGSGKSAALRRLVAFSDASFRATHEQTVRGARPGVLPEVGAVDIAAVATGRTSLDLIDQLGRALGIQQQLGVSPTARVERLIGLLGSRGSTTVVIDAIDEARDPRGLVTEVLEPLTGNGSVRLILGVRGGMPTVRSDEPTLVDWAATILRADVIAVDAPPYWVEEDLVDYADILLRTAVPQRDAGRPNGDTGRQVAARIAAACGKSFLLTTLLASDPAVGAGDAALLRNDGPLGVVAALARIVTAELENSLGPEDRVRAVTLLRAAAISFGLGVPRRRIWPKIATAIAGGDVQYGDADVRWLLQQRVGGYLSRDTDDDVTVYRPFHAELGAALSRLALAGEDPAAELPEIHGRVFDELAPLASERVVGGATIPPDRYIARYLAEHADAAGRLDDVLTDPRSLVAADPYRLLTLLGRARSDLARSVVAVYRGSAGALVDRSSRERASLLEFTARQQNATLVADRFAPVFPGRPWVSRWARWTQVPQHQVLADGLVGIIGLAVTRLPLGTAVVVAESQGTVRALDLDTGRVLWTTRVTAATAVSAAADIVAVGTESEVVLLDAGTGFTRHVVSGTGARVRTVALSPDASLLAVGDYPGSWRAEPAVACVWQRSPSGCEFTKLWSVAAFKTGILSLSWRSSAARIELVVGGDPHRQPENDQTLARVFDGTTGTLIASLPTSKTTPAYTRASPSGRIITLQGWYNVDLIWWKSDNSAPEQEMTTMLRAEASAWDFDDRSGTEAVIGADYDCVRRVEMSGHPGVAVLAYERAKALIVADGLLITASETGALTRWNLNEISRSTARPMTIGRAWSARAGSLIYSTSPGEPGVVRIEDASTGSEVRHGPFAVPGVRTVTVVDEHDLLLVGDSSGRVHGRRSSAVDEELFRWQVHKQPQQSSHCNINSIAFHDNLLITAGDDGAIRFTDWRTGTQALPPVTHHGWTDEPMLTAIAIAEPGGETAILAGNKSGQLLYWRLSSLLTGTFFDEFNRIMEIELTRENRELDLSLLTWISQPNSMGHAAIPSMSGHIQVFDIAPGSAEDRCKWRAHDGRVSALCDSGNLLYSADVYGIVRAWADVREGTPRLVSELSTGSPTQALLPLATGHIAVVATNGLAVVRCNAR